MNEYYPFKERAEHDLLKEMVTAVVKIESALNALRADEKALMRSKIEDLKNVINRYYSRNTMKVRKDD
jgi:hypothetical protein